MTSVVRLSRFGKIAALSAIGGSGFIFRDEIKQYFLKPHANKNSTPQTSPTRDVEKTKLIEHLPEKVPFLLVGGGAASHSAMRAIRGHNPKAKVLIITKEDHTPYMRPALSKELWYSEKNLRRNFSFKWWNGKERSIFYEIDEFYIPLENLMGRENGGVSIIKNVRLDRLNPDDKEAHLETGQTIKYEKCLLAPGGTPKTLPALDFATEEVKKRILYFRTADDFIKLDQATETARRIVIIGGGFLGSELACALSKRSSDHDTPKDQVIYQIYPESGNLGKVLPQHLSEWLTTKIRQEGAQVLPQVEVKSINLSPDGSIAIHLSDGSRLDADYIVCAVGLDPDVQLAKESNLEVDEHTGGYLVNSELEARTDVWVAGDASCFYDIKLGRRRVEHHDHAIHSGRQAGQNMLGAGKAYTHQSMFWSDLGSNISFEAVGIIDSSLHTVSVFTHREPKVEPEPDQKGSTDENVSSQPNTTKDELDLYDKGVIFYIKNDVIVGILLWNTFNRLNLARRILNEQKKYDDYNEVAKLFNLYSDE